MGRVIVPTPSPRALATRALEREGVDHIEIVVEDDYHYSRILTDFWPFTVLEHDVVPWHGAMRELENCDRPWCVFEYPFAPGNLEWALGCLRVNPQAAQARPDLPEKWRGVVWNQLDGKVCPALIEAFGPPHIHKPGFAHIRP